MAESTEEEIGELDVSYENSHSSGTKLANTGSAGAYISYTAPVFAVIFHVRSLSSKVS